MNRSHHSRSVRKAMVPGGAHQASLAGKTGQGEISLCGWSATRLGPAECLNYALVGAAWVRVFASVAFGSRTGFSGFSQKAQTPAPRTRSTPATIKAACHVPYWTRMP